jgi:hypothetical protein
MDETDDIKKHTSAELKKICRDEKMVGYAKLNKTTLVKFIKINRLKKRVQEGMDALLAI